MRFFRYTKPTELGFHPLCTAHVPVYLLANIGTTAGYIVNSSLGIYIHLHSGYLLDNMPFSPVELNPGVVEFHGIFAI